MSADDSWTDYESDVETDTANVNAANTETEPVQTTKRKVEITESICYVFPPPPPSKKGRYISQECTDKWELLSILDPDEKLAVYEYLRGYDDDPIVKTFVDSVIKYKVIPILPSPEIVVSWCSHEIDVDIPEVLRVQLVTNFMKYFESKCFYYETAPATQAGRCLFDPLEDLDIPNFHEFPLELRESIQRRSEEFALDYQEMACKSTEFILQQILLKNIAMVKEHIQNFVKLEDEDQQLLYLEKTLAITYEYARTEFPKVFNVKALDWSDSKAMDTAEESMENDEEELQSEPETTQKRFSKVQKKSARYTIPRKFIKAARNIKGNSSKQPESVQPNENHDLKEESFQSRENGTAAAASTSSVEGTKTEPQA